MPRKQSDEVLLTFCDVAAYFSSDEWKLLHEWQKELYNNVMKEIQQALSSLGPLIANSVFSLRPKEKENLGSINFPDLEITANINPVSSNITAESMWFEGDQYGMAAENRNGMQNSQCHRNGNITAESKWFEGDQYGMAAENRNGMQNSQCHRNDISSSTSLGQHPLDQRDSKGKENIVGATGFPFLSTEHDAGLRDYQYIKKEESSSCLKSEPVVTAPPTPIGINEEGETYAIRLQDYQRIPAGYGGTTRAGNTGKSGKYKTKSRFCIYATQNRKETVIESSQKWSESKWEFREEKNEQWQSGCRQTAHSNLYQMATNTPNVQMSEVYNKGENAMSNDNFDAPYSNTQPDSRPYICAESEQTHPLNRLVRHLGANAEKGRFACTDCGKCFLSMSNLVKHKRIHTGERPFHCSVCAKRFTEKGALLRHQILHTGEKPYQCNVCGNKFNVKHNLVRHQKMHSKVVKIEPEWSF